MRAFSRANKSSRVVSWVGGGGVILAVALVLGGCTGSPAATPTTAASSAVPTTPSTTAPTTPPAATVLAPLTGMPVAPGSLDHASIASKIDNQIDARPQVGLQYTDLVFEELVEGGLTRYVAVWQSQIPKLYGPVRSIRGMDPSIVSPLGGIITYSGGQQIFKDGIMATKVINVSHDKYGLDPKIFYRTKDKKAPHNVIAHAPYILDKFGKGVAAPAQQFSYADSVANSTAVLAGTPTTSIKPTFSTASKPSWKWDAATGLWLRSQNGVKDKDNDGKQLSAVNVITLRVTLKTISHTPVSQLSGKGKITVSTGGKSVTGTWVKKAKTDKIQLLDAAGAPINLAPGNSWIELVASGGSVTLAP